jgi:hypothetical protein
MSLISLFILILQRSPYTRTRVYIPSLKSLIFKYSEGIRFLRGAWLFLWFWPVSQYGSHYCFIWFRFNVSRIRRLQFIN